VEVIQQWLQEDKQRPAKQRHTAKRIYERLREEYGYQGSDRTVRREVRGLRGKVPESHVPQTYQPADGGTFDFGEAYVLMGGQETKVHLGFLRQDYSSKYLVVALPSERQEALFECHLRGFAYLGVPRPHALRQPEAGGPQDPDREKPPGTGRLGGFPLPLFVRQ
jgi:transposase